jgi:single-stranded DNA-binding protein
MITLEATIVGNVGSMEKMGLVYTPTGKPVFKFNVAVSNNYWDKNEGKTVEKPPTWYNFAIWGENQIEKVLWIEKGMHVLVKFNGLEVREYEKEGGKKGFSLDPRFITDVYEVTLHKKGSLDNKEDDNELSV